IGLAAAAGVRAAGSDGNLYVLGIALDQAGAPGAWNRIGSEGAWKGARAGAVCKGRFYTAEADGTLRAADLDSGERKQIGNPDFGDTLVMVAQGDNLYTIKTNGNLFRVNPNDGGSVQVGPAGAWKAVRAAAVFKGHLYTASTDGTLRAT